MGKSLLLASVALFSLSGCIVSTTPPKTQKVEFKEPTVTPDSERITKWAKDHKILEGDGGQPGVISFAGVIVQEVTQGHYDLLDQRFEASINTGRNVETNVNPEIAESNRVSFSTKIAQPDQLAKAKTDGHYISVGCNSVSPEYAGKLTPSESTLNDRGVRRVFAQTVVVCGTQDLLKGQNVMEITADHLVLIDLDSESKGAMGVISMRANKLTLVRKNKIATRGLDSEHMVLQAPWINITVAGSVEGNGWLVLESRGGDKIPPAAPPSN